MNQMLEIPLHAGPEMDRAINRTDFFRLYKSATRAYGFEYFLLLQHGERNHPLRPTSDFLLTNIPEQGHASLAAAISGGLDGLLTAMYKTTSPFAQELSAGFPIDGGLNTHVQLKTHIFVVPLYAPDNKRYWLLMMGDRTMPDRRETAEILLDVLRIFNKFYDRILISDVSSKLTVRETEVVRWTSEGKTSSEIAIILGLSEHTIISHITAAARKLNAVNRAHMIAIAVRRGLVF
jgi:DNA-binding CsgD family transcriptional regulator